MRRRGNLSDLLLEVRPTANKGRGVFALESIDHGSLIESAHVILLLKSDPACRNDSTVHNYWFDWDDDTAALALGFGSIYNHSYSPNATYKKNPGNLTLEFTAIQDIKAGDEITVNYNGDPSDQTPLWFTT